MHATEKKAADIAMSEVDNCVNALQTLESTWPGAAKCKELLIELAQQAKENLAKVGKPKNSRYSSRGSGQFSPTGSNHDRQEMASKPQENRNLASQITNGGQQRSSAGNVYALLNPTTHSTPSPPMNYMPPIQRSRDDTIVGRPLTIHDSNSIAKKCSQPGSPEFGPDMQGQYGPLLPQQGYNGNGQSWRLPSPPTLTYLSDPRFFNNPAQDFSGTAAVHDMARGAIPRATYYGSQSAALSGWGGSSILDSAELPPFGMDFMQGLIPTNQVQLERAWDAMPEVFNDEPGMFGFMGGYQDGQM